jgi:excinuclease ABC subunit C
MPFGEHLKSEIQTLPEQPGVYKYFDKEDKLIYVGKAKNLKKRVSSYFSKHSADRKTLKLVSLIQRIEYVIVHTEYDALLLENTLIKEHQPRYNINLKDDKTYPYLLITNERFPRIFPVRRRNPKWGTYYGPFASVRSMKTLLDLVRKVFGFRTCRLALSEENISKGKFKVCLEYHLGNCKGPCEALQAEDDYLQDVQQAKHLIRGNTSYAKNILRQRMQYHAELLEFEKAQAVKQKLELIEKYQAGSVLVLPGLEDHDVFAITTHENDAFVNYLRFADGAVVLSHNLELKRKLDESEEDILALAIVHLRELFESQAGQILTNVPVAIEMPGIECHVPQRGDKRKLVEVALKNALFAKKNRIETLITRKAQNPKERLLLKMQQDLRLSELPVRIECFDNSNLQGSNPVASMVCFINAQPAKKEYRHFNIKTVEGPNDFASMKEIVGRRYKRVLEEQQPLPQLIVIDGGKGQLSAAIEALQDLKIYGQVAIIGIAKRLEEIYFPNDAYPLHLEKKSETLMILQRLRDEAHRFAITFHRNKRSKKSLALTLESLPGFGKKTVEAIYKKFGSLARINEDSRTDVEALIGPKKADALFAFIKGES